MKKKLTRAELEAIGENWYQRRNKLLDVAHNEAQPQDKRVKAFALAFIMNMRITKIAIVLGQHKVPNAQIFPPGGPRSNTPPGEPEYVIRPK